MVINIDSAAIKRLDKMTMKQNLPKVVRLKSLGYSWRGIQWDVALDEQKNGDVAEMVNGYKVVMEKKLYNSVKGLESINLYGRLTLFGYRIFVS